MTATPRTAEGRDFLRDFEAWLGPDQVPALRDRILAIEAEAAALDVEALARALVSVIRPDVAYDPQQAAAAILAALRDDPDDVTEPQPDPQPYEHGDGTL